MKRRFRLLAPVVACAFASASPAQSTRPWVATGNLSVQFIRSSPIGAGPRDNVFEPPPSVESLQKLRERGLSVYEDYVSWGAVEREPGQWLWKQQDAVEKALHAAGLKYVAFTWVHFPPRWLREEANKRTLLKCVEHGQETNTLSLFDPRTIERFHHFYKALAEHFGERIDAVFACIMGPYGEGNYPLPVPDWVSIGHNHEGYWCGDEFAIRAFAKAMHDTYRDIASLNRSWGMSYRSFDEIRPPAEITEKFKPTPDAFPTPQDKRRWLDFVNFYHQAMVDFAEQSLKVVLKYFPADKVRLPPGGNHGGINPIPWGTDCPAFAKMAAKYHVVLEPGDCQGRVFGDKWLGTAYQFYGVKLCTEPAGPLDRKTFLRRMFSDATCGAAQLFTYEFENHAEDIRDCIGLYTGKASETQIALLCPTAFHRLGDDLEPTIAFAQNLRDLCDFNVLDERLVRDGALTVQKYKVLIIHDAPWIDQPALDRIDQFIAAGGNVIVSGALPRSLDGATWKAPQIIKADSDAAIDNELRRIAEPLPGWDGERDGAWMGRRGQQLIVLNTTDKPLRVHDMTIPPYEIRSRE